MTIADRGRRVPLHERVVALAGELTATERAAAEFLAEHPDLVATASAAELGGAAGTSGATIVRTVKKLGYQGLPELRKAQVETIMSRRDPAAVLGERIDQLAADRAAQVDVVDRVAAASVHMLAQTTHLIDEGAWSAAVDILAAAESVLCYGNGQAGAVAEYFSIELAWQGCRAHCLKATGLDLSTGLLPLSRADAVVLVAPLRHFREVDVVVDRATEVGAPVVLISEALGMAFENRVDVVLATPQTTPTATCEVLAPMMLAHALALDLATRDRDRAVATYQLVNRLRRDVVGGSVDVGPPTRRG